MDLNEQKITTACNIDKIANHVCSPKKKEVREMAEWFEDIMEIWYTYMFG